MEAVSGKQMICELDLHIEGKQVKRKPKPKRRAAFSKLTVCPWQIVVDTREQLPYTFMAIPDAIVPTTKGTLKTGDYSIQGMEALIAWERKSLSDFYGSITWGRERFEREIARLNCMRFAVVGIEATWQEIMHPEAIGNGTRPESITGTIRAWEMDYPVVKWYACGSRAGAERGIYRAFARFWNKQQDSN